MSVRQKAHSAAYASFDGVGGGMILDLTEILDLSVSGMSVQTAAPLPVNRPVSLVLDLSETKSYVKTSGSVAWRDMSGRTGVRFTNLPEISTRQIKEWLFANCLVALSRNSAGAKVQVLVPAPAEATGKAAPIVETVAEPAPAAALHSVPKQVVADGPALNDIQKQIQKLGTNTDAALKLLADHARAMTRASGAAIALAQATEMVCRASSGDAPGLGARFQVGSGFSSECVHTGKLQQCDDAELDSRVDRQSCHLLNIRSIIAAPVISSGTVVGLLEVFSPRSYAFGEAEAAALHRLTEIIAHSISSAVWLAGRAERAGKAGSPPEHATLRNRLLALTRNNNVLVMLAVVLVLGIATVALAPRLLHWPRRTVVAAPPPRSVIPGSAAKPEAGTLDELRRYAAQGDPVAQFALGARYAQGDEVKQDYLEAVHWFQKAADQGHVVAQATLGAYYWAGRGVQQDLGKAYFWSALARAGGDEASKYRVAALTTRMSRAQVTDAQQRAEEWLHRRQSRTADPH